MFAMIDIAYLAAGIAVGIHYHDPIVGAWQKVTAWVHGGEAYAASIEAKGKALLSKAEAVKAAATTAAKS
jgi:hypothetical protein